MSGALGCRAITSGPKHHFFGFHDLPQWNEKGDLLLGLEVDDISHPPLPGQSAVSGVIDAATGDFAPIHTTTTFNYPQGSRQQWLGTDDLFLTNDREGGRCVCRLSDARSRKIIDTLSFPVHCHVASSGDVFHMNYDRLHRVGGYGYIGGRDPYAAEDIPAKCGIFKGNLKTGANELLISLADVSACDESRPVRTGYPHYVTHLSLSPNGSRLAFLHRYRVVDGGELTRLMTVGVDGSALRCLAKGFLSHFDWLNERQLLIWGKDERALCHMREAAWLRVPGLLQSVLLAKRTMRFCRALRGYSVSRGLQGETRQNKSFLRLTDMDNPPIEQIGVGVLREDGHPMRNPKVDGLLVNDTYPHEDRKRTLMLYDVRSGERGDLGEFPMSEEIPNEKTFDSELAFLGLDTRVRKKFPRALYLFTRSGLHCDLHPRWNAQGTQVSFDSIHEGTRQIYAVDCSRLLNEP